MAPALDGSITLCVPTLLGFDGYMGCGLGRSIGHLARGHIGESWAANPLGIPAVLIIIARIVQLVRLRQSIS